MPFDGKKFVPNPRAPRTGILPRLPGATDIGNGPLLRATDSMLKVESVAGTPKYLQNIEVVPVVVIAETKPFPRTVTHYDTGGLPIAGGTGYPMNYPGLETSYPYPLIGVTNDPGAWFTWPDAVNGCKILAAETVVRFTAGNTPSVGERLVCQYWLGVQREPNGDSADWTKIAGGDVGMPIFVDNSLLQYRFAMGAGFTGNGLDYNTAINTSQSAGGATYAPNWKGWLLPPTSPTVTDNGMLFGVTIELWSVGGGTRNNFPTGATVEFNGIVHLLPVHHVPFDI